MGWGHGSKLAEDVWAVVRNLIPPGQKRMKVVRKIIELFEDRDCDTIDEAETLCVDAGRVYDEVRGEFVYTPLPTRKRGVPSREEMYRILKARSEELLQDAGRALPTIAGSPANH